MPFEIHTGIYLETLILKLKTINTKTRMLQAPTYTGPKEAQHIPYPENSAFAGMA